MLEGLLRVFVALLTSPEHVVEVCHATGELKFVKVGLRGRANLDVSPLEILTEDEMIDARVGEAAAGRVGAEYGLRYVGER